MYGELSERKKQILRAIVDAHISMGEPVGSKYLTQSSALSCSAATVRNEMAELEEMGYLEQPHTSAGRVPSVAGYRFYVDSLLKQSSITAGEIEQINQTIKGKLAELDLIMARAARLASSITNYTAVSIKKSSSASFKRFEIMYIGVSEFILLMLTQSNSVKNRSIHSHLILEKQDCEKLASLLNIYLANRTADEITLSCVYAIEAEMGEKSEIVNTVVKAVYEAIGELDEGEMRLEGLNRLLEYPEYADVDHMRGLMGLMERKSDLMDVITTDSSSDDVHIYIGSENSVDVMKNSTLVFKTVRRDGKPIGAIGIIGPCRMDYSRVIATVDRLASSIADALGDSPAALPGGQNESDKGKEQ
jgi:heat-inducible transcriptional repressor